MIEMPVLSGGYAILLEVVSPEQAIDQNSAGFVHKDGRIALDEALEALAE
jgi:hypothetical protein